MTDADRTSEAPRHRPALTGAIVRDASEAMTLRAGGATVEVPRRFIVEQRDRDGAIELVLSPDAIVVVSTVVSSRTGFIAADVFGALSPALLSDNCNCNCNCGGSGNCNCNCNCNCDCGGSGCAGGIAVKVRGEAVTNAEGTARRFRLSPGQRSTEDVR